MDVAVTDLEVKSVFICFIMFIFSFTPKLKNLSTNGKLRDRLFKFMVFTANGSCFVSTAFRFSCYNNSP